MNSFFFSPELLSPWFIFLAGVMIWLVSRLIRNQFFFVKRSLKFIDQLVEQRHLTPEQGRYYEQKIIEKWLKFTRGISPQEVTPQLSPKSEP